MRLPPVAGVALPSAAALSLVDVPWYAWLTFTLSSLAVLAWRFHLDHIENLARMRIRQKEIEVERTVKLKALEDIEKIRTEHASQLMASITLGTAGTQSDV